MGQVRSVVFLNFQTPLKKNTRDKTFYNGLVNLMACEVSIEIGLQILWMANPSSTPRHREVALLTTVAWHPSQMVFNASCPGSEWSDVL